MNFMILCDANPKKFRYGLFEIVRETKTRYYFDHVGGDDLNAQYSPNNRPGGAFNYHSERWLDKEHAKRRAVAWVSDTSGYNEIIQSHDRMCRRIGDISAQANTDKENARSAHEYRIESMIEKGPGDEETL